MSIIPCSCVISYIWPRQLCGAVRRSGVAGLQRAQQPLPVVLAEEGLSELVGADHDGARRSHFDHPGEETWGRDGRSSTEVTKVPESAERATPTCKQPTEAVLGHDPAHHADGGRRRPTGH